VKIPRHIPPKTLVRLTRYDDATPHWRKQVGREFRVGYYSSQDGLDCLWFVNDDGEYEQSTSRAALLMYFEILKLSHESDLFGSHRPPLGPRRSRRTAVA
jgi:hypothetical protein